MNASEAVGLQQVAWATGFGHMRAFADSSLCFLTGVVGQ